MTYGQVSPNPGTGIKKLYKGDRAEVVWSDAELDRLAEYGSPELIQAVRLAILTGMRQADSLHAEMVRREGVEIVKRSAKSRKGKEYATPLYGELRIHLETLRSAVDPNVKQLHATVLTTKNGLPWKPAYLSESFGEAAKRAGMDKHFHDLRGTTATKLYLLNFTLREIAEMLAWEEDRVDRIIKRYVTRDAMVRDRIRRLDGSVQAP